MFRGVHTTRCTYSYRCSCDMSLPQCATSNVILSGKYAQICIVYYLHFPTFLLLDSFRRVPDISVPAIQVLRHPHLCESKRTPYSLGNTYTRLRLAKFLSNKLTVATCTLSLPACRNVILTVSWIHTTFKTQYQLHAYTLHIYCHFRISAIIMRTWLTNQHDRPY